MDDIPTVKFVYIQWIGESTKIMTKAQAATHKGGVEEVFYVSSSVWVWVWVRVRVCVWVWVWGWGWGWGWGWVWVGGWVGGWVRARACCVHARGCCVHVC